MLGTVMNVDFSSIESLRASGFTGFQTVRELWADSSPIPREPGVYLVLRPDASSPRFLHPGVGGFFKGQNPNVNEEVLTANVVRDTLVVYIGKAGSPSGKATLQSRLRQYLKFGQGKNIGHWGGRFIWQLEDHADLIFCWKPTSDDVPREVEKQLLQAFRAQYGEAPFANLTS